MRFLWLAGTLLLGVACSGTTFTSQGGGDAGKASAGDSGSAGDSTPSGGKSGAGTGGSATAGESVGGSSLGGASGEGGRAGASAGSAGMVSDIDTVCPVATPTAGKACRPGLSCSYGSDPRPSCRSRFSCGEAGRWSGVAPAACPPVTDCSMTPSGFPIVGKECKTIGESCSFDGMQSGTIQCACGFCGTDATCPMSMRSWQCAGPPAAPCPEELPNEGQACAIEKSCSYGVQCQGGVEMTCDGKLWSQSATGCAN